MIESSEATGAERPALRVVRGRPSSEEVAALITVLARAGATGSAVTEPGAAAAPQSRWRDRGAALRAPLRAGAGAWRASGLPR